jgi:AcrR family transcriptional regulator
MAKLSTKDKLSRAAVRLIAEHGYERTSIGDIEKAAGLTAGAGGFYRHFKSKEDLLIQELERVSNAIVSDIELADILALKSPRAELLAVAKALMQNAEHYRPLRVIIQSEIQARPTLRKAVQRANERIAVLDVVPWVEDVLHRARKTKLDAAEMALIIFGPIFLYIRSLDRGAPSFGLTDTDSFLESWVTHWAEWLTPAAKPRE